MTTVTAGNTGSTTLTTRSTVTISPDASEVCTVAVTRSGVQVYGEQISGQKTIGPFNGADVFTLTANRGNADYTVTAYTDPSSAMVLATTEALTASALIKTGPAYVVSLLMTSSGGGKVTLRNGVTVGGSLVAGWGGGGASGLASGAELTLNTPYSVASTSAYTDFVNGLYCEISGTATVVVSYR